jgi:hypothetical protein
MYCRGRPAIGGNAIGQYRNAVNLARRWLLTATSIKTADGREVPRKPTRTDCDELFSLANFCDFARWLAEGRAPSTTNGRVEVLWMLWSFASDEGLCDNPLPVARKKPRWKELKRDPVAWTLQELDRLIAACVLAPPMRECDWWTGDFWLALISGYLATSERFTALMLCPRTALIGNVLTIPAELTKDKKEAPVVLEPAIADRWRALPAIEGSPLFFPYPYSLKTLRERFTADLLISAKLPIDRHHKFHCLRRTAATQIYIVRGIDAAMRSLRHFSASLTMSKYVSQAVVQQQMGTPNFDVPCPKPRDPQMKLF